MVFKSKVRVGKGSKTVRNFNFTRKEQLHHYLIDNLESIGKGLSVGGTLNANRIPIIQLPPHAFDSLVEYNRLKRFVGGSFLIEVPMDINHRSETLRFKLVRQEVQALSSLTSGEESTAAR